MRSARIVLLLLGVAVFGCDQAATERRARQAAEQVQEAMGSRQAAALAQTVAAEDVEMAQRALTQISEYQGEINGKLDSVTVNAIQAFQRSQGIDDDGLLEGETRERLRAVLAKAG